MISDLVALLKDDDAFARYCTAMSLVKFGKASKTVTENLVALLKDDDASVRHLAAVSLVKLGNSLRCCD